MSDPATGAGIQRSVNVHLIPLPNGARLVFMTTTGQYVGSLQFDAVDKEGLGAMGNLFQQFAAQQAGGIQIATGTGLNGLRQ